MQAHRFVFHRVRERASPTVVESWTLIREDIVTEGPGIARRSLPPPCTTRARTVMAALAAGCLAMLTGCAGLATRPGEFDVSRQKVTVSGRTLHATYVKPEASAHPSVLVVFFTGDAGWLGASGAVFEHLAEQGYEMVGYNSHELLKPIKKTHKRVRISVVADALAAALTEARTHLGVADTTPLVTVGVSRGASAVVFTVVQRQLRQQIAGAIPIALTRESDYLRAPDPADRAPEIQVDDKNRIQLYPALDLSGAIPVAVIQSTGDSYVPSPEARTLLGPDTPTRRLYEVEARNHGFSGGRETLLHDLDDALRWIKETRSGGTGETR
jgi:type IV secretory pathway VirJ component